MLFASWKCMVPGVELPDAKEDYKSAQRAGQYKASERALYRADNTYLPYSAITEVKRDKSSVHVTGCCCGGVPVERLIVTTQTGKFAFLFDSAKTADRVAELCRTGAGLEG